MERKPWLFHIMHTLAVFRLTNNEVDEHVGLPRPGWAHLLCSLCHTVWKTVRPGCSFTLPSPGSGRRIHELRPDCVVRHHAPVGTKCCCLIILNKFEYIHLGLILLTGKFCSLQHIDDISALPYVTCWYVIMWYRGKERESRDFLLFFLH